MLPEALVIFACINSKGCKETSSHYYNTHPAVRKIVEMNTKRVEEFIGPQVIATVGPMIYVVAGGTGTVRINRYFSLQASKSQGTLSYRFEW